MIIIISLILGVNILYYITLSIRKVVFKHKNVFIKLSKIKILILFGFIIIICYFNFDFISTSLLVLLSNIEFLIDNFYTYSNNVINWLVADTSQIEEDIDILDIEDNYLNPDELNEESSLRVDTKTEDLEHQKSQKEDLIDKKDYKPFYKDPYIIGLGIVICLIILDVISLYNFSLQNIPDNIPDNISDSSSALSSSPTIVGSDISNLSTSSVNTLINQTVRVYNQTLFNYDTFITALQEMSYHDLSHFLPYLGYDSGLDREMLRYLVDNVETNTLDFHELFTVMGEAPLNIFRNYGNSIVFNSIWTPTEDFPNYTSFVNYILQEYVNYVNYVELDID